MLTGEVAYELPEGGGGAERYLRREPASWSYPDWQPQP